MNRRGFLGSILALCAAPAIVRIGSLMPVRNIVLPTDAEFATVVGNPFLTIDEITREALRLMNGNVSFIAAINKQYDAQFSNVGNVLTIRRPRNYA